MNADDLVDEQIAYYRARAPWYDDWWNRRGQHEVDDDTRERWHHDVDELLADLDDWLGTVRPTRVVELAAGTGNLTRQLAPRVERVVAIDSSPEVFAINAEKIRSANTATSVEYVVADIFDWRPSETFDAAVFGFWISHVPASRWDRFWTTVHDALVPGGHVWFCDNARPEVGIDHTSDVHERGLPDGRTFRLVKRFYEPEELQRDLEGHWFSASVRTTDWAFLLGRAVRG